MAGVKQAKIASDKKGNKENPSKHNCFDCGENIALKDLAPYRKVKMGERGKIVSDKIVFFHRAHMPKAQ